VVSPRRSLGTTCSSQPTVLHHCCSVANAAALPLAAQTEGSLDVFKDGEWTTLRPGATATVPPGVPHTLRNGADEPAKIVTRIRPAGRSEAFFRHMHKLIGEGKLKRLPPKEPRSAVYAAMLFNEYPDEIRATGPLNGVFKALALVGKALRFEL
jgi:hypothetical protein